MPEVDQVHAITLGLVHIVSQALRGMAVHQHLAGDQSHGVGRGLFEQGLGAHLVHGGEDHSRRSAMGPQGLEEALGAVFRHGGIGVAPLGREGVGVEPVQQGRAETGDHVELRAMHMRVDEAGHDQAAAVVLHRGGLPGLVQSLPAGLHRHHTSGLDQHRMVRTPAHTLGILRRGKTRVIREVQHIAPQDQALGARSWCLIRSGEGHGCSCQLALRTGSACARVGGRTSCRLRTTSRTCSRNQRLAAE